MRRQFRSGLSTYEIADWRDLRSDEIAPRHADVGDVVRLLQGATSDPLWSRALRGVLADQGVTTSGLTDAEVLEQLAWRITRRELALITRTPAQGGGARGGGTAEAQPVEAEARGLEPERISAAAAPPGLEGGLQLVTFIEIEMVDDAGEPAAGEAYEIEVTDGSTRRGTLNSAGRARIDGITPGTCKVRFPDLDGGAWEPAQG